jgi:hypothetical protein
MDYKVPARTFIKKSIHKGRNPLLPNFVGHIGRKPVYEANRPLDSMDDIILRTERGVREVTTEEWGNIQGYPSSWGTTAKDRRWIIQEPSLHFWSVLGGAFHTTFNHPEDPKFKHNEEEDASYTSITPLSPIPPWEEDSSDEESEDEVDHPLPEELDPPPKTWMPLLNGRLLICKREDNGMKQDWINSAPLLRDGMTKIWL